MIKIAFEYVINLAGVDIFAEVLKIEVNEFVLWDCYNEKLCSRNVDEINESSKKYTYLDIFD